VATPLWPDELLDTHFSLHRVIDRIASDGDPWAKIRRDAISLSRARFVLEDLIAED
jgi:DNA primase